MFPLFLPGVFTLFICFPATPLLLQTPRQISRGHSPEHRLTSSRSRASRCTFPEHSFCTTPGSSTRSMGSLNPRGCPLNPVPPLSGVWSCWEHLESSPVHSPRGSIGLTHSLGSECCFCLLTPTLNHVIPCERRHICLSESLISTNGNCPPHYLPRSDIQLRSKGVVQFILIYALD